MNTPVNLEIALEKLHQLQHEDGDLGARYWYEISCLLKEAALYRAHAAVGPTMTSDALHAQLGHFVLTFQAVEAAIAELIVQIMDADPEQVATLTAELEFTAKSRALDVVYTRFARINGLTDQSPEPKMHKLVKRIQNLASRRNELVHSFYAMLTTNDGVMALLRQPTKLKPSEGLRLQQDESILPEKLGREISEMQIILSEIEAFRLAVIDVQNPLE